ncbi:Helix-turn-helix [Clostridium amylolyticum]|uniref:Helix-turn-helix n=1 Tax=Clostridium amylolyticum TaxID=1121298 RepID=A0A1M6F0Q4_9CLOT|nr:helix-turn-helix transcriptional regulator [Clostridium amylolyticum]SHI91263.1 Helix-turn-helix [Clostridium amylolyticum]
MNKIKFFRQKSGLTLRQLSEKANISIGYISDLENNKTKNPTMKTLEKLSEALGVYSVTDLISASEKEDKEDGTND